MSQSTESHKGPQFTGWHMLAVMVGFFMIIVTVNMTMVYFSRSSWTGLIVKNSYVASQQFNERLEVQEKLLRAGWQAELMKRDGQAVFEIMHNGALARACDVTVDALQPMNTKADMTLTLSHDGSGLYKLPAQFLKGRWDLSFHGVCPEADGTLHRGYRLRDGKFLPFHNNTGS